MVQELRHPNTGGVDALHGALDQMDPAGWSGLESAVLTDSAVQLAKAEARIAAHKLAIARALEASGAARAAGATSTGDLLARGFGGDRRAGDALVRTAKAMEPAGATETALARGEISTGQAEVIGRALVNLPADARPEDRRACEDTLIGDASRFTLTDLRRRADRITDVFKPRDDVDAHENELLVERERNARKQAEFWMIDKRDGTHEGGFRLPDLEAKMLLAAVQAISAPRRDHLHGNGNGSEEAATSEFDREMTYRHRLGLGFAELATHLPSDRLPAAGGVGATLTVNLDYSTLVDGVRAATLSTGDRVSAAQARKLACRVGIIPAVFDGDAVPLDHGRLKRCFTKAQRQALEHRDHGCTFPGCDRPPQWCEGHHGHEAWADGGTTDLADGVLICPHHHHLIHEPGWGMRFNPDDGIPEYRPPGTATWQRNIRWRP